MLLVAMIKQQGLAGMLHPAPKYRFLYVGYWEKVSKVKSHGPKSQKSELTVARPSFVFQQGAQQRKPSFRRKDTRSSTYWERRPLFFQNELESTEGPRIMFFHSMSFCSKVDEMP